MDEYKRKLLYYSSKLDAMVESNGEISEYARLIVEEHRRDAIIKFLKIVTDINELHKYNEKQRRMAYLLKDSMVRYMGYASLMEMSENKKADNEESSSSKNDSINEVLEERTLEELIDELNSLVGLKKVKEKVNDLIVYQKVQRMRRQANLHSAPSTLHMAFIGNPGTGKTTVARIVGRIYKQIGLLSSGHFIEVSRTDLIAGYQGQTALKVKNVIERARGGVLFIDEAYSITENENSDSYGRECLTELTKALEDYRDDLVVIVAGYKEPMKQFFESNPGLKSRFNTFIYFEDYTEDELDDILESMCRKNDYELNDKIKTIMKGYFLKKVESKEENFSNGRLARNIYDDLVMNHAKRVIKLKNPDKKDLSLITEEDFCMKF